MLHSTENATKSLSWTEKDFKIQTSAMWDTEGTEAGRKRNEKTWDSKTKFSFL